MGGHPAFRRLAVALGCLVAGLAAEGRAQLAGLTPQFPYGPCYAAPLEAEPPGATVEWLGGDGGSMAVFPDGQSTFWAFGDTFLGPRGVRDRVLTAAKVVNTIAIGQVRNEPQTGRRVFAPRYYYRGNFTWDTKSPGFTTNNPSPFFLDPDAYSNAPNNTPNNPPDPRYRPNRGVEKAGPLKAADCSRFFAGKAIFVGTKLFVFLNRVDGQGQSLGLGCTVARINNPCTREGRPTDPLTWQIDYLKLSEVGNPFFGAEAFIDGDAMLIYCTYTRQEALGSLNVVARIPLDDLLNAPGLSNLAPKVRYLNKDRVWTVSTTPENPIGPQPDCFDVGIPCGGGFTARPMAGGASWRVVFVDHRVDTGHVRVMEGPSPLGPWSNVRRVFRFPELDPANRAFDPASRVHGFNAGIYCRAMAESKAITSPKCYQAYEIPQFSTDPDRLIAFTYACDRGSTLSTGLQPTDPGYVDFFPPGCQFGQPGFWLWDNNFYRVKGVPGQAPFPIDAAEPGSPATGTPAPAPTARLTPPPPPSPPGP